MLHVWEAAVDLRKQAGLTINAKNKESKSWHRIRTMTSQRLSWHRRPLLYLLRAWLERLPEP
eukprot:479237-Prorocentrum_lima.AAC.1